jgi:transcriptional regulator with XRE-family HTH domain
VKKFAFNLLEERLRRNQSQRDIADICEVFLSTVSRWENGKTRMPPGYIKLLKLQWKQPPMKS